MLGRRMSMGDMLRFPAPALGVGRSLKRPRTLLSHHHHRPAALFTNKSNRLQQRQQRQQRQRQQPPSVAPVAIIGAGPAGLTLSALLSKFGVPSILLERSPALPTHPQAHFINLRSMEIMRHAFGGLDRRVLEMCPPQEEWRDFVVCSTVLGRHLARIDNFSGGEAERRAISPTGVAHLSQNVLLPVLLEEAQRAAVESCPSTQIQFDAEVIGLRRLRKMDHDHDRSPCLNGYAPHSQLELSIGRSPSSNSAAGAAATVAEASPENEIASTKILCRYVIAADGAGSSMREAAGIGSSGRRGLGSLVNIHFRCKDLGQLLLGEDGAQEKGGRHRPGMLYFVYNEETICVLVAHNVQKGEWACQVPFFPPHQTAEFFTPERSAAIVRGALGPGSSRLKIDIRSVRPWTMNAVVADSYFSQLSNSGGRGGVDKEADTGDEGGVGVGVILVGDAAHQFPPAGGFGLNTGVQDAHNLAWKLAAVHHGLASSDLLLSYEAERRPVAMRNAALSVRNLKRSLRVLETLGVDPNLGASADLMDQLVHSPLTLDWNGGISNMASSLLSLLRPNSSKERSEEQSENILRLGRRQLESLRNEGHPYGESRVRALRRLLADGGGLPLLFPDHDVGFRYGGEGAAVFSGTRKGPPPIPHPRLAGAAEPLFVRNGHPFADGEQDQAQEDCSDGADSSLSSSSAPRFGMLRLGGRMPHFILRPSRDESIDSVACNEASVPSLSTVDLPDQIRGLLLSLSGSILGSSVVTGASRARASLASVLIVSPIPTVAVHSGDTDGPGGSAVVAAAGAVSARWVSAAVAAQQPEVGVDSKGAATTGEGAEGTYHCTWVRPLVVLTVSPPSRASIAAADATITTTKTMPSIKHLAAFLDHRSSTRTTPLTSSEHMDAEARTALAAQGPQQPADGSNLIIERLGSKSKSPGDGGGGGQGSDTKAAVPGGQVLSMRAIDDSAERLGKAFAAAGTEAILLRPDGHIAWMGMGPRPDIGSELGGRGDGGGCSDPALVQELRRALDTVYAKG